MSLLDLPLEQQKQIAQEDFPELSFEEWQAEIRKIDEQNANLPPIEQVHLRELPMNEWYHWANYQARVLSSHTTISPEELLKKGGFSDDEITQAKALYLYE